MCLVDRIFLATEGHYLGHNRENIAGGHDFISADGSEYVHSQDNPQGGAHLPGI